MDHEVVKRERVGDEIVEYYYDLEEGPMNPDQCEDPETLEDEGYILYRRIIPAPNQESR